MILTHRPKRSGGFRDKYLAPLVIAAASIISLSAQAQFPSTDSLRRYNNVNIRNNASTAFTNLRLNTLITGMIDWIDSARTGEGGALGVDTLYALNDSTIRYRMNGVSRNFVIKGGLERKVDSIYAINDTTFRFTINGQTRNVLIRGAGGSGTGLNTQTSIAGLRAMASPSLIYTYYVNDRGKEGSWYYDPSDLSSTDNTGTILTSGTKRFKRIYDGAVNVKWFDVDITGATDASPGFQKAVDATPAGGLLDARGAVYRIDTKITRNNNIKLLVDGATFNTNATQFWESSGTLVKTTTATVAYSEATSKNSLTLASVTGIVVGDIINIQSNELYDKSRAYYYKGGNAIITKITGSVVYFDLALPFDMTIDSTINVKVYTPVTIEMTGKATVNGLATLSTSLAGITINYGAFCKIEGVSSSGFQSIFRYVHSVNIAWENCYAGHSKSVGDAWNGYGFEAFSCTNVSLINCNANSGQHGLTTGGQIPCYNVYGRGGSMKAETLAKGIGVHENTFSSSFNSMQVFGFETAGNSSFTDCDIMGMEIAGSNNGLMVAENPRYSNFTFKDVRFWNNNPVYVTDYYQQVTATRKYVGSIVFDHCQNVAFGSIVRLQNTGSKTAEINSVAFINGTSVKTITWYDNIQRLKLDGFSSEYDGNILQSVLYSGTYGRASNIIIRNGTLPRRFDVLFIHNAGNVVIDGVTNSTTDYNNNEWLFADVDRLTISSSETSTSSGTTYGLNFSNIGYAHIENSKVKFSSGITAALAACTYATGVNVYDITTSLTSDIRTSADGSKRVFADVYPATKITAGIYPSGDYYYTSRLGVGMTSGISSPFSVMGTSGSQRRTYYDLTHYLDETVNNLGDMAWNLNTASRTYSFYINGVLGMYISPTGARASLFGEPASPLNGTLTFSPSGPATLGKTVTDGTAATYLKNLGTSGNITNIGNVTGYLSAFDYYGSLGIGVIALNNSAALQIDTKKGFLGPRLSSAQRDTLSAPVEGMEIWNTDTHQKEYYVQGTGWVSIVSGGDGETFYPGWGLVGPNDFAHPVDVDTTDGHVATQTMVLATKDSIGRIAGRDSFQVYQNSQYKYSVKDSTGSVSGGDDWGVAVVHHDATQGGQGTVGLPLTNDTTNYLATKYDLSQVTGHPLPPFFGGTNVDISGDEDVGFTWNFTGAPGTNPAGALNILDFGGARNAVIPGTGTTPTSGTDNTPAFNAMMAAALDGQVCYIPYGNYWFKTVPDTIRGPKRVHIIIYGNTYHINTSGAGIDFIIIKNESGAYEQHRIEHRGQAYGKINMPTQDQAHHDAGTGPVWSGFTGTLIKLFNTNQQWIELNKAEGFKTPVDIMGQTLPGDDPHGSQENTVIIRYSAKNANAFTMSSLNGSSYCDKNHIWISRASGGLGLKIDGYSGAAANGEIYNGAFRSNDFHIMFENVDSIAECNGDITEPEFDFNVEGSGVLGAVGFKMRSVSPNYVRSPWYHGRGVFGESWVQAGMGLNGMIMTPIWNSSLGRYYGMFALINGDGNIVFQGSTLTNTQRLAAPANFRFAPFGSAELTVTITSASYSVPADVKYINYSNASGTITLPSASTNVDRIIYIKNDHGSAAVAVSNVKVGDIASIPAGQIMAYKSDGTNWRSILNLTGTGGGGTSPYTADPNGYTTGSHLGNGIASKTGAWTAFGAGTTTVAPFNVPPGTLTTTPLNGHFENDGDDPYFTNNSTRRRFMMVPDGGGLAGQIPRKNAGNTGTEYVDPAYQLMYENTGGEINIQNTTSNTTMLSGVGSLGIPSAPDGSRIVYKASGYIYSASGSQTFTVQFNAGGGAFSITRTVPGSLSASSFTMEFYQSFYGTSDRWYFKMEIDNGGSTSVVSDGSFSTSGWAGLTDNLLAKWSWATASSSNRIRIFSAGWEVFRRQ